MEKEGGRGRGREKEKERVGMRYAVDLQEKTMSRVSLAKIRVGLDRLDH